MIRLFAIALYKLYHKTIGFYYQWLSVLQLYLTHATFDRHTIKFYGRCYLMPRGHVRIGSHFKCNSGAYASFDGSGVSKIDVAENANLIIGDHTGISNTTISCTKEIRIGNYVDIGGGCLIMDSNYHSLNWEKRMSYETDKKDTKSETVIIGDHVFIGARSIICKGVRIGEKSIIASGSVVVSNIPDSEIWGGNPAKFIKVIEDNGN